MTFAFGSVTFAETTANVFCFPTVRLLLRKAPGPQMEATCYQKLWSCLARSMQKWATNQAGLLHVYSCQHFVVKLPVSAINEWRSHCVTSEMENNTTANWVKLGCELTTWRWSNRLLLNKPMETCSSIAQKNTSLHQSKATGNLVQCWKKTCQDSVQPNHFIEYLPGTTTLACKHCRTLLPNKPVHGFKIAWFQPQQLNQSGSLHDKWTITNTYLSHFLSPYFAQ